MQPPLPHQVPVQRGLHQGGRGEGREAAEEFTAGHCRVTISYLQVHRSGPAEAGDRHQ